MYPKDADDFANSADPDQTASSEAVKQSDQDLHFLCTPVSPNILDLARSVLNKSRIF